MVETCPFYIKAKDNSIKKSLNADGVQWVNCSQDNCPLRVYTSRVSPEDLGMEIGAGELFDVNFVEQLTHFLKSVWTGRMKPKSWHTIPLGQKAPCE